MKESYKDLFIPFFILVVFLLFALGEVEGCVKESKRIHACQKVSQSGQDFATCMNEEK